MRYEAIAEKDHPNRRKGDPLFPELKSLEFLLKRKKIAPLRFEALYQGNPCIPGGEVFKKSEFRYFKTPRAYNQIVQSWDTAYKPDEHNDYSVCGTWGVHDEGFDLLHVWRRRVGFSQLESEAIRHANEWHQKKELFARHPLFMIIVEDKASGTCLIEKLRQETNYSIKDYMPKGDKLTRAHTVTPFFTAGKVFFKEDAPWLEDLEHELLTFDNGKHDDQVDMLSQLLAHAGSLGGGNFGDEYLDKETNGEDKWDGIVGRDW